MSLKALKFGGSSLADAIQFRKVADIIGSDPDRRYVVPSAPGKRYDNDTKVTDMLYSAYDAMKNPDEFDALYIKIKKRYDTIIQDLALDLSLDEDYERIRAELFAGAGRDYAASRGEYLSGKVLSALTGYDFIDAAELIFFNADGKLDEEGTYEAIYRLKNRCPRAVIPGFYGLAADGSIKTFTRGGSDITGAIVARGVGADIYENWTDVSGFLVTDPHLVENPRGIDVVTFRELRELSYMGASVLHEDAVFPVKSAGIPINIRNTNRPADPGTMIVNNLRTEVTMPITGISGKRGFSILHIEKDGMNNEVGFTRRALEVFERHNISFEHLPSGIDTMGVVVQSEVLHGKGEAIAKEMAKAVNADIVEYISGLALIAVVGRGMVRSKGTAARVFSAIARANINVRFIDQGSSELNIIVGVDEYDFRPAVNAIYDEFFPRD